MYSIKSFPKLGKAIERPPLRSAQLLEQLRERIRYKHNSISTEEIYVYRVFAFVRFDGLRQQSEMGGSKVCACLSWLAVERRVTSSTYKRALAAITFLYREVFGIELPWLDDILRPKERAPSRNCSATQLFPSR